jgi:fermentation-respiration switch protein FrsA (DUF1100 family)
LSRSFRPLLVVLVALAFLAAACGGDDSEDDYGVRSRVVGDENTQDILVFEPDAEGSWPVVLAFHGFNGSADQMAEIGKRLAATGFVVFAPNYRTDLSTEQGIVNAVPDAECGYRYVASRRTTAVTSTVRSPSWAGPSARCMSSKPGWTRRSTLPASTSRASPKWLDPRSSLPRPAATTSSQGSRSTCSSRPSGRTRAPTSSLRRRERHGVPRIAVATGG